MAEILAVKMGACESRCEGANPEIEVYLGREEILGICLRLKPMKGRYSGINIWSFVPM